jgi:hypothetical protein
MQAEEDTMVARVIVVSAMLHDWMSEVNEVEALVPGD